MPITYPPAAPSVSGNIVQTHAFLKDPTLVARRLRTLADQRYIADALLTQRLSTESGAVQYQQGESIFTDDAPEGIQPGGEYPLTSMGEGSWQIASTKKWGQDVEVTDEAISRQKFSPVDRALMKLVNQNVNTIDALAMALILAQVTATHSGSTWSATGTTVLEDAATAKAKVIDLKEGFEPDVMVVNTITFAKIVANKDLRDFRMREDKSNPVYTGDFPVIDGMRILPSSNWLAANGALVLDTSQLGGMADENLVGPGYTGGLGGVQAKVIRQDENDSYRLRARRVTVPIVLEPAAAIRITGV